MGTSHSFAELDAKLQRLAREMTNLPHSNVEAASLIVKKSVSALLPSRLRGTSRKGSKLDVRFNMDTYSDGAKSLVYPIGKIHLLEDDLPKHDIPRVRTRGKRRYGVIGGHPYSVIHHPGTKGKHPWARGVEAALPAVKRIFDASGITALRKVL